MYSPSHSEWEIERKSLLRRISELEDKEEYKILTLFGDFG